MPAFWMCDLEPTEIAGSDAFNQEQCLRHGKPPDGATSGRRFPSARRLLRVLVIDDQRDTTDSLVRLAQKWGHTAWSAYDGAQGLRVAFAQRPDVVLVDISMPHLDGCQMVRRLRLDDRQRGCLVVAVTGRADRGTRRECAEAGIDLVLIKPVDPAIVQTLLILECERVNRQTDKLGLFAANGACSFAREEQLHRGGGNAARFPGLS